MGDWFIPYNDLVREVIDLIVVKDFFKDIFRAIGWTLIKIVAWFGNLLLNSIDLIIRMDFLTTIFNDYWVEVKLLSFSLLGLTLIVYGILQMLKPEFIKGLLKQMLISVILLSSLPQLISFIQLSQNAIADYYSSTTINIVDEYVTKNTFFVAPSVTNNQLYSFNDFESDEEMSALNLKIDVYTIDINMASNDEPLDFKIHMVAEDGTYFRRPLESYWWGATKEKIYIFNFNFIEIFIPLAIITLMLFLLLFKITFFIVKGNLYPIFLTLVSSSEISGQRTKNLFTAIINTIASLFITIFSLNIYSSLLPVIIAQDNLIVIIMYLIALGLFGLSVIEEIIQKTGVANGSDFMSKMVSMQLARTVLKTGMDLPKKAFNKAMDGVSYTIDKIDNARNQMPNRFKNDGSSGTNGNIENGESDENTGNSENSENNNVETLRHNGKNYRIDPITFDDNSNSDNNVNTLRNNEKDEEKDNKKDSNNKDLDSQKENTKSSISSNFNNNAGNNTKNVKVIRRTEEEQKQYEDDLRKQLSNLYER